MATIHFKGKELVRNYHLSVPYHELKPIAAKSASKKPGLNDNLIIHGDNLLALKALLPTYAGKVKCIYIDPPYNTGNEKWAYNDKVNSPMMKEWLGKAVDREDLTRHDKWLCMMTPRLQLLRELLRDDGVIFVSIDDNEVAHLRLLMDEVFGEENFVASIVWQKKYAAANDAKGIPEMHDYILAYQKSEIFARNLLPRTEKQDVAYKNDDGDGRGLWRSDNLLVKTYAENCVFPIINPNTGKEFLPKEGNSWRANKETVERWLLEERIFFGKDGEGAPQLKRYLQEVQQGIVPVTWWPFEEVGHNDEANKELQEIFGNARVPFETPKPVRLIKRLLQIGTDKNSIILDSFAGSGTTAHAALALNKEDGGNRKFILVECEDYADKITAERVRRVMKGYGKTNGMGGTFSYFELGKTIDAERILKAEDLPTYLEMARYIFYTATGGEFDERKVNEETCFIGESAEYKVYLLYKPDLEYLKTAALTLDLAQKISAKPGSAKIASGKKRLVFAPMKFLDREHLERFGIEFAQLPFEVYNKSER